MSLSRHEQCLTGLCSDELVSADAILLLPQTWRALEGLQALAREAGFDLRVASGHRDFARQLHIWNGKLRGDRPVLDDRDRIVSMAGLSPHRQVQAVLRFSALPGASRHHWGTDVDVFDAQAMPDGYRLQLSGAEVADGGIFGPFHAWLDERIARGESFGFYRPYAQDRGGVAPERWHLSYAPLAREFQRQLTPELLRRAWEATVSEDGLACQAALDDELGDLVRRYVQDVDEPGAAALGYRS